MSGARALRYYLAGGGIIAYPTESCFGLGCDPYNRRAVQRLLRLKGRPQHKGLILIAATMQQIQPFVGNLSQAQQTQLQTRRPRPHTWLAPAGKDCPRWLSGRHQTVAIRITDFPPARALCKNSGMALVSTSANPSGGKPVKNARECYKLFGNRVRVLPGRIGRERRPSTIQDLATGKILRA